MATQPEYGLASHFPTVEDLLKIRTATTILAKSSAISRSHGTALNDDDFDEIVSGHVPADERGGLRASYTNSDNLVSIMDREHEIVALTLNGQEPIHFRPAQDDGDGAAFMETSPPPSESANEETIYYSQNPSWSEHAVSTQKTDMPSLRVTLSVVDMTPGLAELNADSVPLFWIRHFSTGRDRDLKELRIPSPQHANNVLGLLRSYYGAETTADRDAAAKTFIRYIYWECLDKISSRIGRELQQRHLGVCLSQSITSLANLERERLANDNCPPATVNRSDQDLLCHTFSRGGDVEPQEQLDDIHRSSLSDDQRAILEYVYKKSQVWQNQMQTHPEASTKGLDQEEIGLAASWDSSPLNRPDGQIFYDMQGRLELQRVLATICRAMDWHKCRLKAVHRAVKTSATQRMKDRKDFDELHAEHQTYEENKGKKKAKQSREKRYDDLLQDCHNWDSKEAQDLELMKPLVEGLKTISFCLAELRRQFPAIMESHLFWLSVVVQPSSTINPPSESWKSVSSSNRKTMHSTTEEATTFREHAGGNKPQVSLESLTVADPKRKLLDIDHDHPKEHHVTMSKSLGIVCRFEDAITGLLGAYKDTAFTRRVRNTVLQSVKSEPHYRDKELMPLDAYLNDFEMSDGTKVTEAEAKELANHFTKNCGIGTKAPFVGTWHAETVLISLYLLAQQREESVDLSPKILKHNEASHLELPPKALTDRFKHISAALAVTKRCCPTCFYLVEYVQQKHGVKTSDEHRFLYPGVHSDWTGAALPPWIPIEAYTYVYNKVHSHVQERFDEVVYPDTAARSGDSGGSYAAIDLGGTEQKSRWADEEVIDSPCAARQARRYSSWASRPKTPPPSIPPPMPSSAKKSPSKRGAADTLEESPTKKNKSEKHEGSA